MTLKTERLLLRPFREEDFDDYCLMALDAERNRLVGNEPIPDRTAARETFAWWLEQTERVCLAMEETHEGRVIGSIQAAPAHPAVAELPETRGYRGYTLSISVSAPWRRRGYASEAIRALTAYLFTAADADYVNAGYFSINPASGAMQEKLGFRPLTTGLLERAGETYVTIDNILRRGEWEALAEKEKTV